MRKETQTNFRELYTNIGFDNIFKKHLIRGYKIFKSQLDQEKPWVAAFLGDIITAKKEDERFKFGSNDFSKDMFGIESVEDQNKVYQEYSGEEAIGNVFLNRKFKFRICEIKK